MMPMTISAQHLMAFACRALTEATIHLVPTAGKCHRSCAMQVTTVDQKTLKSGKEPLHMLSTFRSLQHLKHKFPESKYPSKAIFFGNLCTAIGHGIIRVGDSVSRELRDGPME